MAGDSILHLFERRCDGRLSGRYALAESIPKGCNLPLFSSTRATSLPKLFKRYSNSSIVPFFPAAFLRALRRVLDVILRQVDSLSSVEERNVSQVASL